MNQPNPWILFIGGGALLNLAMLANGLPVPPWVRYPLAALCVALGITSGVLAVARQFGKKPERPRVTAKRAAKVELPPELSARLKPSEGAAASPARPRREPPRPR
jgi:hypothetical protein